MKITYVIAPKEQLLIEQIEGNASLKDFIELTPKVWEDKDYNLNLRALIDIRNAHVKLTTAELGQLSDFLINSGTSAIGELALVVTDPMEVAMSYMFEKQMTYKRDVAVFSTIEEAFFFLNRHSSLYDLLNCDRAKVLSN